MIFFNSFRNFYDFNKLNGSLPGVSCSKEAKISRKNVAIALRRQYRQHTTQKIKPIQNSNLPSSISKQLAFWQYKYTHLARAEMDFLVKTR